MEVRGGMGLVYLHRRFVFALVWYSVSKRFEVREFVSNRLYMCNEFTSICIETACIETTLYRNVREPDDLASEVETDRTRQNIRRNSAKFRRRLQERVQLLLS